MHKILNPHRQNAIVYLDDVLVFSKTLAEHKCRRRIPDAAARR
jgi:hypothetical protein